MKTPAGPAAAPFFRPPEDIFRENVLERLRPANPNEEFLRKEHQAKKPDQRQHVATCAMPQRIRARQSEPRVAGDCHQRISRRAQGDTP